MKRLFLLLFILFPALGTAQMLYNNDACIVVNGQGMQLHVFGDVRQVSPLRPGINNRFGGGAGTELIVTGDITIRSDGADFLKDGNLMTVFLRGGEQALIGGTEIDNHTSGFFNFHNLVLGGSDDKASYAEIIFTDEIRWESDVNLFSLISKITAIDVGNFGSGTDPNFSGESLNRRYKDDMEGFFELVGELVFDLDAAPGYFNVLRNLGGSGFYVRQPNVIGFTCNRFHNSVEVAPGISSLPLRYVINTEVSDNADVGINYSLTPNTGFNNNDLTLWYLDNGEWINLGADEVTTDRVVKTDIDGSLLQQGTEFVTAPCPKPIVSLDVPVQSILCQFQSNTLEVVDPNGDFTYEWSTGETTRTVEIVPSTTDPIEYSVTITDASKCFRTFDVPLTVLPIPGVNIDLNVATGDTLVVCEGNTLSLTPTVTNTGTNGEIVEYSWNTGETTQDLDYVGDGSGRVDQLILSVQVTNFSGSAAGCSRSDTIYVRNDFIEGFDLGAPQRIFCDGTTSTTLSTGIINTSGLAITWSGPGDFTSNANEITVNETGTYTVTVNNGSCTIGGSVDVFFSNPAGTLTAIGPDCHPNNQPVGEDNSISLRVEMTSGVPPFQYFVPELGLNNQVGTDIFTITTMSPEPPFLPDTDYTVEIIDGVGCMITLGPVRYSTPIEISIAAPAIVADVCGENLGSISLTPSGGSAPYNYNWSNGQSGLNLAAIENLAAAAYSVTITDANGCELVVTDLVVNGSATGADLDLATNFIGINCPGETTTVNIVASGGNPGYTYSNNGTDYNSTTAYELAAGNYTFYVRDVEGCDAEVMLDLLDGVGPGPLTANFLQEVDCAGETATVEILPLDQIEYSLDGVNYDFNNVFSGLSGGSYRAYARNFSGCIDSVDFTVIDPEPLVINVAGTVVQDDVCGLAEGLISLVVNGGTGALSYEWDTPAGDMTCCPQNLTTGTYNVTVTDENMCTLEAFFEVGGAAGALTVGSSSQVNASCNGAADGSFTIPLSGGTEPYRFTVNDGPEMPIMITPNTEATVELSALMAGDYNVVVLDANDCAVNTSVTLFEPAPIVIVLESSTPSGCGTTGTGTIDLTITGPQGLEISWSDDGALGPDRNNLMAGNYTVTVSLADNPDCFESLTVNVAQLPSPVLSVTVENDNCLEGSGSILVTASGGETPYSFAWADGTEGPARTGLSAGEYTVTVTDQNECTDVEVVAIGSPSAALTITGETRDINCFNANNGAIVLRVTGGTMPYIYLWSNAADAAELTDLAPGDYDVTVLDANNCAQSAQFTLTEPEELLATAMVTNVAITGGNEGAIDLDVSGGTLPYRFAWTNNGSIISDQEDLTNLEAGIYEVLIRDAMGCRLIRTFIVNEPSSITLSFTETPISCNEASDGTLTVNTSGGPGGGFNYRWILNGIEVGTTQTITNLGPGDYIVQVAHPSGNGTSGAYNLVEPAVLSVAPMILRPSCTGEADGLVQLNASGGTGVYTYDWSDGLSGANPQNLLAGDYDVTITDERGCTLAATVTVDERAPILIVEEGVAPAGCGLGGSIDLTITGPADILISWADGPETEDRVNLAAGDYTVTVRRAGSTGCSETMTFSVGQLTAPELTATVVNDDCQLERGSISLSVSGGEAPFIFTWADGPDGPQRNNLSAGDYAVTVTDVNECSDELMVTVTAPATALTAMETLVNISCNGAGDGSIFLEASGGTAPYRFNWSNGATVNNLIELLAGDYAVTILDANDCSLTGSYTITSPEILTISAMVTDLAMPGGTDGAIDVTVDGGTEPYSFDWALDGNPFAMTEDLAGLSTGTYQVVVTDDNGCTIDRTYIVNEPSTIALEVNETPISCAGVLDGSLNASATGGVGEFTFRWTIEGILIGVNETIEGLGAGTYIVSVTDENGNENSLAYELLEPAVLVVLPQLTDPGCAGDATGAIVLEVSGGTGDYAFTWADGEFGGSRSGLTAGTYEVTVTDMAGCELVPAPLTLIAPAPLALNAVITPLSTPGANDGEIDLTVSGGTMPYTYSWSNDATTEDLTELPAGTYTITVTDNNDCTDVASFTIDARAALIVSADLTDVSCNGGNDGAIDLMVSGGDGSYTFTWEDGSDAPIRTGLTAGTYQVTITNSDTPDFMASYDIEEPGEIDYTVEIIGVTCFEGADGQVSWESGSQTGQLNDLTAGEYEVTITNDGGCMAVVMVTVPEPTEIQLSGAISNVSTAMANDGAIDLTVSGGTPFDIGLAYRYAWQPNGQIVEDLSGLSGGEYTVTVTDANGCMASQSFTISEPGAIIVDAVVSDVSCNGDTNGSINLTATGGFGILSYAWADGPTSEDRINLSPGDYTVSVSDINGLVVMETFTVGEPAVIVANPAINPPACPGQSDGSINLAPSGGTGDYAYLWEDGSNLATRMGLAAGNYAVTITDDNSCFLLENFELTDPAPIAITLVVTAPGCGTTGTGAIDLTASGGMPDYTYRWGGGQITEDLSSISAGTYSVTVTDANGCTADSTFNLMPAGDITELTVATTDVSCSGGNDGTVMLTVLPADQTYTYLWSNGETTAGLTSATAGMYSVTVSTSTGCAATISATVAAPEALVANTQSNAAGCSPGEGGSASVVVSGGTPDYTYLWSNGTTDEATTNLSVGPATVTVTDANGCTATSTADIMEADDDIEVKFLAATPVDALEEIQFVDVSFPRPQTWFYDFADPGGNFSEVPNPTFAYPFDDMFRTIVYPVTLTATSLFCEDFVVKDITIVSVNRRDGQAGGPGTPALTGLIYANIEKVNLYPNPTRDYAEVHIELNREAPLTLSLVDPNGRVLQTDKLSGGDGYDWVIDLTNLPAGAYFVRVQTDFGVTTKVLILQ